MGREKTDFAALFKAPFIVLFKAMKNTIQFWLTHFKSDSKRRDKQVKYK